MFGWQILWVFARFLPFSGHVIGVVGGEVYAGYWISSTTALQDSWYGITTNSNGDSVYAIRSVNSGIYYSPNYGLNFYLSSAPYKVYKSITCSGTGALIAAVADATVNSLVMSTDSGATWKEYNSIANCHCWRSISVSLNGNYLVAVGTGVGVHYSRDGGASWEATVNPDLELNWTDVSISNTAYVIATTIDNGVWSSSNNGESWGRCPLLVLNGWTSAAISSDGKDWFAVNSYISGGIYAAYNLGCQLTRFPAVPRFNFTNVAISATATRLMISSSNNPYSYYSNTSGNLWYPTDNSPLCSDLASNEDGTLIFATDYSQGISYFIPGSKEPAPPSVSPSIAPTTTPTSPTYLPSNQPTGPTISPTVFPSLSPSRFPSSIPSTSPSSQPTLLPTFAPTSAEICPKGTYRVYDNDTLTCQNCPSGTFSQTVNASDSSVCRDCDYPATTLNSGSSSCSAISLHPNILILYTLGCFSICLFLILLATLPQSYYLPVFLILIVPLFDVMTDLLYFLTSTFYNTGLFVASAIILFYPVVLFSYRFVSVGAFPVKALRRMAWLSYSSTYIEMNDISPKDELETPLSASNQDGDHIWYPTINSRRFSIAIHLTSHNSIFHLLFELLNWTIAIILQVVTFIIVPFCLFLWFLFGVYLEATKLIHITSLWNLWFRVWTLSDDFIDTGDGILDTHCFNYAILVEFFFETLPQLIIQGANNTLVGSWTSHYIGIISFVISALMAFNVAYRYLYHSRLQSIPISMKDIPIHSLLFKLQSLTMDTPDETLPSPLRPYTKQIRQKDTQ